jgi:hypothetical protein
MPKILNTDTLNSTTANSTAFVTTNGTSTQFVKGDGTLGDNPVTVAATSPQIVDKRWYGTQAQYTALGTYDNNTEYNII